MNKLLRCIADYCGDVPVNENRMIQIAEQAFIKNTIPLLHKAFTDSTEYDEVFAGISHYVAAMEAASYLSGIRDCIGLLFFNGTYDDLHQDR